MALPDVELTGQVANGMTHYNIPFDMLESKYKGCGNGWIAIDKSTDTIVDMGYGRAIYRTLGRQNINMCTDAGDLLNETKKKRYVRANFSCGQACLF